MIEKLAELVSPILLPMGVSYADILFYLNAISNYLLIGLAALVILVAVLIAAVKVKKAISSSRADRRSSPSSPAW